jgi:hypothetical protein
MPSNIGACPISTSRRYNQIVFVIHFETVFTEVRFSAFSLAETHRTARVDHRAVNWSLGFRLLLHFFPVVDHAGTFFFFFFSFSVRIILEQFSDVMLLSLIHTGDAIVAFSSCGNLFYDSDSWRPIKEG